ncbi:MAG: VOC family protein [bacterium]|nr:VOC family protein [bacterium]
MDRPVHIAGLDHVVLRCRDLDRTRAFYEHVLGCVEERRVEAIGLVQLRAGASLVDLVPDASSAPREAANMDHVCVAIAPTGMDDVLRWLAANHVETIGEPTTRYGARGYALSIYLRDPEGNVVELAMPDGTSR